MRPARRSCRRETRGELGRWLRLLTALSALALAGRPGAALAADPQIWFAPNTPGPVSHGAADWRDVFLPGAPWQVAASHTALLIAGPGYFNQASDAELRTANDFLLRHNAAFGVGIMGIERVRGEHCGTTEGYSWPGETEQMAARLRRLGIVVRHVEPDEALWFGHFDREPGTCGLPVAELVKRVAQSVNGFLQYFPDAEVGEVEPIPGETDAPGWRDAVTQYRSMLQTAIGRPVAYLNVDVDWTRPDWPDAVRDVAAFARGAGLRFGIIYNGDGLDLSEQAWMAHARANIDRIEGEMDIVPDTAIFSSWNRFPDRILPETSPNAHSNLILSYLQPRPRLVAAPAGLNGVAGQLLDAQGQPVSGAPVDLTALGVPPARLPPTLQLSGEVPAAAVVAAVALELNARPPGGAADLRIGGVDYSDTGATEHRAVALADAIIRAPIARSGAVVATRESAVERMAPVRLRVAADQAFRVATGRFPVDGGTTFTLTAAVGSLTPTGAFGSVQIVWFGAAGHDLGRVSLPIGRSLVPLAATTTDAEGRFVFPPPPPGATTLRVRFPGSAALRPAAVDVVLK